MRDFRHMQGFYAKVRSTEVCAVDRFDRLNYEILTEVRLPIGRLIFVGLCR